MGTQFRFYQKTKAEDEEEYEYDVGRGSSSYSISNPPEADKRPTVPLRRFVPLISAGFHISLFNYF
jgi:hypothetical protein